jgi:hypothetical protein
MFFKGRSSYNGEGGFLLHMEYNNESNYRPYYYCEVNTFFARKYIGTSIYRASWGKAKLHGKWRITRNTNLNIFIITETNPPNRFHRPKPVETDSVSWIWTDLDESRHQLLPRKAHFSPKVHFLRFLDWPWEIVVQKDFSVKVESRRVKWGTAASLLEQWFKVS